MPPPPKPRRKITRLLLVEDDKRRHAWFTERVASIPDARLVWARTGGAALNIINKEAPNTYAGLMLDHDLDLQAPDPSLITNGKKVVSAVIDRVDTATPILVHSANKEGGPAMMNLLTGAGFDVTRIVFSDLTTARFAEWLQKVTERQTEIDDEMEDG